MEPKLLSVEPFSQEALNHVDTGTKGAVLFFEELPSPTQKAKRPEGFCPETGVTR